MAICRQCTTGFEITDRDRRFYSEMGVPEPTLCPLCRYQRRLSWRNERTLYKRKCSKTGSPIFSIYPENAPFPVFKPEVWHGDDWDPLEYGQEFDFNRPFFKQFHELQNKVPRMASILVRTENCDYCNVIGDCKNCYLIFGSINCEDCLYGSPFNSKYCLDSLLVRNSQWCCECTDCENLYECFHCQDCANSQRLRFCFDLEACRDCFLCAGLRRKEYHILNQPYSKEEYEKRINELRLKSPDKLARDLHALKLKAPVKFMVGLNNENVTGDHVFESKNSHHLFFSEKCEEAGHSTQILDSHHVLDCDYGEMGDHIYENSGFYKSASLKFCHWCWETSDLFYCSTCGANTRNCFGCVSLKRKQYCILNKQYTREGYQALVPKIIGHMKVAGEWGQFFPMEHSPFAYNETLAQEFFPLTEKQTDARGWRWSSRDESIPLDIKSIPAKRLPDAIKDVPDDILNWAVVCEATGRPFRITPKELQFYRKFNLPVPHFHPDERHRLRMALRNLRVLYDRNCASCGMAIKTTYAPDRPERVLCEACYLKEVY